MSYDTCRVPMDMRPSKDAFEQVGLVFKDIGDAFLYEAKLPEGWKLKHDDRFGGYTSFLYDEKGRERGSSFYRSDFHEGHMYLFKRFGVTYSFVNNDEIKVYVHDEQNNEIFDAGHCQRPYSDEYIALVGIAKSYLDDNYSDWENPVKYWD